MAVTRAAATAYLVDMYGTGATAYLTLAGIGLTDAVGGLKGVIDDAFLASGVAYSDLATGEVADADAGNAFALLRLTALRKVLANLNAMTERGRLKVKDIETSGLVETVKALIAAEHDALTVAGVLPSASGWYAGTINLDFIEPDEDVA